jgi:hypothetical protein
MDFEDWTDIEVELIVADYFQMLKKELLGIAFNKTQHRTTIIPLLNRRSHGSVEFKHQNISAVLSEMGYPFIKGYKPRFNFQRTKLIRIVDRYIRIDLELEPLFRSFSDNVPEVKPILEYSSVLVSAPEIKEPKHKIQLDRRPIKINFLEKEQENKRLGEKGELFILEYERLSLITAGKSSLAKKIEWVSNDRGDGLGFDILSKNLDGTDKFIEVKTTKLSKEAPFFFSVNELNFSIENEPDFHLYRVFNFNSLPQMFQLKGRYDKFCRIEPQQFIGRFN